MSSRPSKWVRRKARRMVIRIVEPGIRMAERAIEFFAPALYLEPRKHSITPSTSNECLVQQTHEATSESLFFQRLPAEIRRQILIFAFGRRKVHMNLEIAHPFRTWSGYECESEKCFYNLSQTGFLSWNVFFGGRPLPICISPIGVMGWLLSCRRAYQEGIAVFYETNTICIERRPLAYGFAFQRDGLNFLRPQRLAQIRSLELMLDPFIFDIFNYLDRSDNEYPTKDDKKPATKDIITELPLTCTGLRTLDIYFSTDPGCQFYQAIYPIDEFEKTKDRLLNPVAEAFYKMGGGQSFVCVIHLPQWMMLALSNERMTSPDWGHVFYRKDPHHCLGIHQTPVERTKNTRLWIRCGNAAHLYEWDGSGGTS